MDTPYDLGGDRLVRAIGRVEVLNVFFPRLRHSLILDTRHDRDRAVAPAIIVDGMVGSPEERMRSFARLRPELPIPERIAVASWLGSIRALVEAGVYAAILERWLALGYPLGERDAERAFRQLARLERAALRDLLTGATSKAIWERPE